MDKHEKNMILAIEMMIEKSNITMPPEQKIERTESNEEENNIFYVE